MATQSKDDPALYIEEQVARIRRMGVETDKAIAEIKKITVETQFMPRTIIFQAMIATAGLLGAGAAIAKLFFP